MANASTRAVLRYAPRVVSRVPASPKCLNCGQAAERFCPRCGQKNVNYRASLGRLLRELGGELFALDSRLLRTLGPFLFQPGELTRAYNAGHRARYVPPLRLYLFASLLCFLVLGVRDAITPMDDLVSVDLTDPATSPPEMKAAEPAEPRAEAGEVEKPGGVAISTVRGVLLPEPWMQYAVVREINRRAERFGALPKERQAEVLHDGMLGNLPTAIFLLLPLYALLLELAFLGTGRYYVEHVVFALHVHAFVFFALALSIAANAGIVTALCSFGIPLYALLALRHAYASAWPATLVRASFVGFGYLLLVAFGAVMVVMASVVLPS